ncbi:hypothetical protein CONCODRAFT_76721 [Conidiobolus coronatus NRRL 28638]|uniref:Uncharacterized protein n=1 Tax=Conidiobolus coronatus (strain ATCC 28846 / CBS 209.66 / NRRL 28638) TaxID=796925 RepID=A0A137PI14_CONC2|nr:hypothetical protein CONCODRAFT_76721 [Conidiobolus coronatus NRRL 28638]|eukprot:KXN74642.1 hypothetical protein CONCODRAFT_76721 [Conidiobolus coronatus NRRL 28638]
MIETLAKRSALPTEYNSNSALHSIQTNSLENSLRSKTNTNNSEISNNLKTSMQQEDISPLKSFSPRQDSISTRTSSNKISSIGSLLSSSPSSTYSFLAEQALFPPDNENETNNNNLDTLLEQDLTMLKSEENFDQSSFTEFDIDSLKRLLRHYCLDNLCMTEENRHLKRDYTATKMNNEALKKLLAAKDNVLQKMETEKQQLNDRIKWLEATLENSLSSKHLAAGSSSKSSSNPNLPLGEAAPRTSSDSNGKPSVENNIVKNIWFKFKKPHEGKHLESEDIDSNVLDMMDSSISSYPSDTPLSPTSLTSPKSKSKSKIFSSLSWSHTPPPTRKSLELESAVNQGPNTMSRAEMRSMLFSKPESATTHSNSATPPLSPPASPSAAVSSPKSKSPLNQVLSSPEKSKSSPNLIGISSLEKNKSTPDLASPNSPEKAKSSPSVTISATPSPEKPKSTSPTKSSRISFYGRPKSRYSDYIKQQEDLEVDSTDDLDDSVESIKDQPEPVTKTSKREKRASLITLIKSPNSKDIKQSSQVKGSDSSPNSSPNSSKTKLAEEKPQKKDKTERSEKKPSSITSHKSSKQRPDKPLPPIPHGFNIKKQQGMVVRRKSSRRRGPKPLPSAPNSMSFSDPELEDSINPDVAQLHIQTPSPAANPSPSQSIETN